MSEIGVVEKSEDHAFINVRSPTRFASYRESLVERHDFLPSLLRLATSHILWRGVLHRSLYCSPSPRKGVFPRSSTSYSCTDWGASLRACLVRFTLPSPVA